MSAIFDKTRRKLRASLSKAARAMKSHLQDSDLVEKMKLVCSPWKVRGMKEESSSYDGRHRMGFGYPVTIGMRVNDEAHFQYCVDIVELDRKDVYFEKELVLSLYAFRRDIIWNNPPVRITLGASFSAQRMVKQLSKIDHKKSVGEACRLLFAEDFLRLTEGLHPRT